jgi:SRSO17 transposase
MGIAQIFNMLELLQGKEIILLIDDTSDCKKGKTTDYVKRQYIGNVGKKENGIVFKKGNLVGLSKDLTIGLIPNQKNNATDQIPPNPP